MDFQKFDKIPRLSRDIVIYHIASGKLFKKTIKDDEKPKELVK